MELKDYRQRLDELDGELVRIFAERMELAAQIGEYKKAREMPILDSSR